MLPHAYRLIRIAITAGLLIVAAIVTVVLWDYYTASPWTRNGQVRTQVANIAPRVSGQILEVNVHDNQYVRKGDVLYVIDPFDFHVQLDVARANVAQRKAEMEFRIAQAERRRLIPGIAVSREEKQQFEAEAAQAKAMYEGAEAAERQAAINLDRSTVHSPINGWVTNLIMRPGDFATAGHVNIQIIDSEAFWVDGYFEETKVHGITEGDPVRVDLMGFHTPLMGHVESITRGIASRNAATSTQGLPLVDPVYTWVRLAQRIPVRVHLDEVPPGLVLSAGMTATVTIVTEEGKRRHLSTRDAIKHMGYDLRRATGHW